jgi:histidinol-phosphatase
MNPDLELALQLADIADSISLDRFQAEDLSIETKPDLSPVSDADRAVEDALRKHLDVERPSHSVLGEEGGAQGDSEWRWIIDPIDGTKNYVRGVPVWATLIGLAHGAQVVAGVASAPAMRTRWWAARGEGAYRDGERIHASGVRELPDASLSHSSIEGWSGHPLEGGFRALVDSVWRTRGFGDFWQHMLVAEGCVDIAVEPEVTAWDMAALQVIVEEAGGGFTDLTGTSTFSGGTVLTTNQHLHARALATLQNGNGA